MPNYFTCEMTSQALAQNNFMTVSSSTMSDLSLLRNTLPKTVAGCRALAARTKGAVSWITLYRIATGRTTNPGIETVEHIKRALSAPAP